MEIVKILLKHKADVNIHSKELGSALHFAVRKANFNASQALDKAEKRSKDEEEIEDLTDDDKTSAPTKEQIAKDRETYLELAKLLIEHKINLNVVDNKKRSALNLAVIFNDTEFVNLIAELGKDSIEVNKNAEKLLPLH